MKVWIDQDLCTGDGLCEEIAPAVFTLLDDGLAYVKEGDDVKSEPGGSRGVATVAEGLEDAVTEECQVNASVKEILIMLLSKLSTFVRR